MQGGNTLWACVLQLQKRDIFAHAFAQPLQYAKFGTQFATIAV